MTSYALLNNVEHHDLKVRLADDGGAFGAAVNQVPVVPTEIEEVQRDYPVVLRRDADGGYQAMALLGLDRDENLFVEGGSWGGRYVPAALQRGPFRIGAPPEGAEGEGPMLYVDLDHQAVGRDGGEPLFREHGGNAPYLDHVARVLRRLHEGNLVAPSLYQALAEHELITPVTLQISLDDVTRYDVPDCFTIEAARLSQLDGAALERLNRAGFLRVAFMISASLGNIPRLIERKNRLRATTANA
ncbi:MAG: SapC family protein [Sphingomonas sp.]